MNGHKLQDRLNFGLGLSARYVGQSTDAFRPNGAFNPLGSQNRFLRLPAAFVPAKGNEKLTNSYGDVLWHGIFDGNYTRPGDYLVSKTAKFFVASQAALLPILCVRSNRIISVIRPNMQSGSADNAYGGYTSGNSMPIMEGWPASVLAGNRTGSTGADLPTDQIVAYWSILLPAVDGVVLSPGDFITDDLRRTAVIACTELTDLGWRISAKMAIT